MNKLPLYLTLLLLITCAKEDSQAPNTPPSQITRQNTLTVSAGDGGSVSTTGGTFASGTQVSITATPNAGYSFSGWSNGSTANPLTVTLNSNTTITANFQVIVNSYTLTVTAGEGGTVTGGGEYEEGTEVTITATAEEGFEFTGWSDGEVSPERIILINNKGDILSEIVPIIIPKRLIGNILAAKIIVTKYGSPSSCSAYKLSAKNSIALAMPVIPPAPQRTLKSRFLKHSLII